jgi:hypothetical protein
MERGLMTVERKGGGKGLLLPLFFTQKMFGESFYKKKAKDKK